MKLVMGIEKRTIVNALYAPKLSQGHEDNGATIL